MDIFDYAMQMEKDGEAYYRELAEKCGDKGLAKILTMLADEEVRHYDIFRRMKTGRAEVAETPILANVKNVFEEMTVSGDPFDFDAGQVDFYREAQTIEKKSEDFYREKAAEIENEDQKAALLKIADEERQHFLILDGIIDFIRRPQTWLEDAEWSNIGREY